MNYFVYFSDAGVGKTGLTPSWHVLKDDSGAEVTDLPAINEIGGGWYCFSVICGDADGPWKSGAQGVEHDLVGVIDGGAVLADVDRYKPICLTLRGLGLAFLSHKGVQDKASGTVTIYAADGVTASGRLGMTEDAEYLTRYPAAME